MTKKHYEAIAVEFNEYLKLGELNEWHVKELAKDLADYFESDNKLFNREKFLNACGIEQDIVLERCDRCGAEVKIEGDICTMCGY